MIVRYGLGSVKGFGTRTAARGLYIKVIGSRVFILFQEPIEELGRKKKIET